MSLLAEPRRRQKIAVDPQNKTWQEDESKFGHKLLEKMGWKSGQGLGMQSQGIRDPVSLKANFETKGLGSKKDADDTWLAHQDNFDSLLSQLNKKSDTSVVEETETEIVEKTSTKSLETKSKSSKSRIHYFKFTRGKDLSRCSADDLSHIFGSRNRKRKSSTSKSTNDETTDVNLEVEESNSGQFQSQTMSVSDYFKQKMASLKTRVQPMEVESEPDLPIEKESLEPDPENEERSPTKKKKKSKREKADVKFDIEESSDGQFQSQTIIVDDNLKVTATISVDVEGERGLAIMMEPLEPENEECVPKKKKKSKREKTDCVLESEVIAPPEPELEEVVTKKHKKRKKNKKDTEDNQLEC